MCNTTVQRCIKPNLFLNTILLRSYSCYCGIQLWKHGLYIWLYYSWWTDKYGLAMFSPLSAILSRKGLHAKQKPDISLATYTVKCSYIRPTYPPSLRSRRWFRLWKAINKVGWWRGKPEEVCMPNRSSRLRYSANSYACRPQSTKQNYTFRYIYK